VRHHLLGGAAAVGNVLVDIDDRLGRGGSRSRFGGEGVAGAGERGGAQQRGGGGEERAADWAGMERAGYLRVSMKVRRSAISRTDMPASRPSGMRLLPAEELPRMLARGEGEFAAAHDFEGEAGGVVAGDDAGVGVAVFGGDVVGDVLGRDFFVRLENGGEQGFAALGFDGDEIGAECHAFVTRAVADEAAALVDAMAAGGVAGGGEGGLECGGNFGAEGGITDARAVRARALSLAFLWCARA